MIYVALQATPISSPSEQRQPQALEISLLRSDTIGISIGPSPPSFLDFMVYSICENLESTETAMSQHPISLNYFALLLKAMISVGQTKVKLRGQKKRTTYLPLYDRMSSSINSQSNHADATKMGAGLRISDILQIQIILAQLSIVKILQIKSTKNEGNKNRDSHLILHEKMSLIIITFPPFCFIQLVKMQNIRKLNIFQLYRKLPYIVFKDTYLLPQFPTLPQKLLNLQTLTTLKQFAKKSQSKGTLKTYEIPSVSRQQQANTQLEMQNYLKNYLALIKQPSQDLICLKRFHQENASYITEQMNGKNITKRDLLTIFKSFPKTARDDYQRRAQEDYQIEMQIFNQFQQLHKIPPLKISTPEQIYTILMKNQKNSNYPKFNRLSKKKKEIYNVAYLLASQQSMRIFQAFLKPFNITREQFDIILQICNKKKEYIQSIMEIKNSKSLIKTNGIELQLASEQLGQDIQYAAKLFKTAESLPQEILCKYETFFSKAGNKKFKLPPLVDWNYQKSERKCYDLPKAAIKLKQTPIQTDAKQAIKKPKKSSTVSPKPSKQVLSQSQPEPRTTQKPATPSDFPQKTEKELQNLTSQLSPVQIDDAKVTIDPKIQATFLQTKANVIRQKIQTEESFEYKSQDNEQGKHSIMSPKNDELDLDKFDDIEGLQIMKNYDIVRRKVLIRNNK